jgi:carbonic anhydrase
MLTTLLEQNHAWSERMRAADPLFFSRLAGQQAPPYLWIGCSDSRVPANQIVDLAPGELFVHRNVGNVVVHSDLNCLSVIQFAIDLLRVRHVLVVGHYECSAIEAALSKRRVGLAENWLRHIQDVHAEHRACFDDIDDDVQRRQLLCELNVIEQAVHVCQTAAVGDAWQRGQELVVHAWIYGLKDGLLRDLGFTVASMDELADAHASAIRALTGGRVRREDRAPDA